MKQQIPLSCVKLLKEKRNGRMLSLGNGNIIVLMVNLSQRLWNGEEFSPWTRIARFTLIEASTFLGHAGAKETKEQGVYVDSFNNEYKLTGVFH